MSSIIVSTSEDLVGSNTNFVRLVHTTHNDKHLIVDPAEDLLDSVFYVVLQQVTYNPHHVIVDSAAQLLGSSIFDLYVRIPPFAYNDKVVIVDNLAKDDTTSPTPALPQFISETIKYVNFSATPRIGNRPLITELVAKVPARANIIGWDFGDGQTAGAVSSVFHTYEEAGEYEVTLTAEIDGVQYTGIKKFYIVVLAREDLPDPVNEDVKGTIFEKTFLIPQRP